MQLKEIQDRLQAMDAALTDKGYTFPNCDLTVKASVDPTVWIRAGRHGQPDSLFERVGGKTLNAAFRAAEAWIADAPDMADHKKAEAVKMFGRAIDAMRDSGIDADFINPLSASLKEMSENLLTFKKEAAQ